MGSDNRDWYRDWWRKKAGYVERALFRRPAREVERERELRFANWHPVLKLFLGAAGAVLILVLLRVVSRLMA
jgi:hypothetical protein